jgi:serine/threonine protein kinase/lipoprotein NlpI
MARLILSPPGGTPLSENAFEQLVIKTFLQSLPHDYQLLPNFILKPSPHQNALELDIVVMATHAIYVVECKEWRGCITGDDTEWLLNDRTPKPWPMNMTEYKCKVLKSFLRTAGQRFRVEPVLVVPDDTRIQLSGSWAGHCNTVSDAVSFLQNASKIGIHNADIRPQHQTFIHLIQGSWGQRLRGPRKKVSAYDLLEPLYQNQQEGLTTYLARKSLISDPNLYRVRVWTFSSTLPEAELKERLNVIRRPTEAVAQIGSHPNLLRILQFDELPNEPGFFEVTEWSEFGTLHGYIRNSSRPQLTIRERLEIAAGIANALVVIHSKRIIHRNICPETILIDFDLQPHLTDFDRAYIKQDKAATVFAAIEPRNSAYVPPELSDPEDYDFTSTADMFCFGVLLYELLTGVVPFQDASEAVSKEGCPAKLPSGFEANISQEIDQLVLDLLRVDDFNARPPAHEVLSILRQVLSKATNAEPRPAPEPLSFDEGSLLPGGLKVEKKIGDGNFSIVYKVEQIVQGKYYAMKVLKDPEQADMIFNEFGTGDQLPPHPNIAAIKWLNRLPPPDNTPYILSEYVEGEKLTDYCEGTKVLSLSEMKPIALALLDALETIHPKTKRIQELQNKTCTEEEADELNHLRKSGILHRDIKPGNILLDNHKNPKLIDFNISVAADQAVGGGGTPRYWAPDRGQPLWAPTDDLFSFGVVLYELITHRHPYANNTPGNGEPYDPLVIAPECGISQEFAAFLLKAVQPRRNKRFLSASEMKKALEAIPSLHAPVLVPATSEVFEHQRYAEILANLNRAIELDPQDKRAILNRGQTYQRMKRYPEALADFDRAINLDPQYKEAIAGRGEIYRLMRRYPEALADFDCAIDLDPQCVWAISQRGEIYRLMGRYPEALVDFACAIDLDPQDKEAIAGRGETYRLMGRYPEALADFDCAIDLDPQCVWAIARRGETYRLMGRYPEALTNFDRAIDLDPQYASAIAGRGETYRLMGRYPEALADFDRAIDLDPQYKEAIAYRGRTCLLIKRYPEALANFDRAIDLDPQYKWAIYHRGETYRLMGRYPEALVDFTQLIEFNPQDKWAIARRGETHLLMGRYREALADLDRAIEIDPQYKWAITERERIYQLMEALIDLDQAIELDPQDDWAIFCLNESYQLKKRYTQALANFDRYTEALADFILPIAFDPQDDWAIFCLNESYQLKERYPAALEDLHQAIDLDPKTSGQSSVVALPTDGRNATMRPWQTSTEPLSSNPNIKRRSQIVVKPTN